MFIKKKATKADIQRKKVMELQIQREEVKKHIRLLRNEMQELIERAAVADDLDRKIFSLEYDAKKADLNTETAHFNELSKLISQLNGVAMVYERQKIFDQVATVAEDIDVEAALRAENQMSAHRTVMKEDSEALDDLLRDRSVAADDLVESAEFTRLVRDAKIRKVSLPKTASEGVAADVVCG